MTTCGRSRQVHLHELGGHDTLIDIVGTAAALHVLGVNAVHSSPLPLGTGHVRTRHGILPCPAPATLVLLEGAAVTGSDLAGETVTPTAAALLRAAGARYDPPPAMTLASTGYGAGTRQLPDRPNVAVAALGTAVTPGTAAAAAGTEAVEVLETNLDDVTGEALGYVITAALAAGALDAWVTPRHTTTLDLDGVPVRVKHGPHGAKPEHDDLAAAAARLGIPLRAAAERAARALNSQEDAS